MKGYKAFHSGWKCRDFQYEIGKTYELPEGQELKICECGFHFCANPIDVFGYYQFSDDTLIAEIEALGNIKQEGTKYVTDKIKIVKEFPKDELQWLICNGRYNSGMYNTGNCNSGNCNSGYHNSGYHNSGHYNSGYNNSGYFNKGNWNSGIFNTDEPTVRAFNKPTNIKLTDFITKYYKLFDRISNNTLIDGDIELIKSLPNFDAKIFLEITGIDLTEDE